MNVAEQIKVLTKAVEELSKLDPETPILGHCNCPADGYWGDLEGNIKKIGVTQDMYQDEDDVIQGVVLDIHY